MKMAFLLAVPVLAVVLAPFPSFAAESLPVLKTRSAFYTAPVIARARANAQEQEWAAKTRDEVVGRAAKWLEMSDDALWESVFGPNLERSWMVWSDGFCPACKRDVRMYAWEMDPLEMPWKTRCPHCQAQFPTNDFDAYRRSGLDEHGVFQHELADRSLLYNAGHPGPDDPLHKWGVDDGWGFVDEEGRRWRFIGAYLIYGQWKRFVVAAMDDLSAAYVATGDPEYARKAAVLFDRVADVFPGFDFGKQGIVYERKGDRGQVSTWHDACHEMHIMTLAYDRIFEGARGEADALAAYLSHKAEEHELSNPKASWEDIQRNIEDGIFRHTLANPTQIQSNYPTTDVALLLIQTVLGWPENRGEVTAFMDKIIQRSTAVDGVSGEKGLDGYATIAPRTLAQVLAQFSLLEPGFLSDVYTRHPVLHRTYRFHIDTWCMDEWYPHSGDAGRFGTKNEHYRGVSLTKNPGVRPSAWSFLWDLHRLTEDPAFAQLLYKENGGTAAELPYDLFAEDPGAVQRGVAAVIEEHGPGIRRDSVNLDEWRIAIMRSGEGAHRRALWLDYDAGGGHGHSDGMNLGLFAKGLDLIPEFGYPPVGYGGWETPKAKWYTMAAAHATVCVDGPWQERAGGTMTVWADGGRFHGMRASGPAVYGIERYERAAAMMDIDEERFYVFDAFFVDGGTDHAKFFHSFFGGTEVSGLTLAPAEDYGHQTQMRHFRRDPRPQPGWHVDWTIEDAYGYLQDGNEPRLRYTDLSLGAEAWTAEGWVAAGSDFGGDEAWLPRVMVRRRASEGRLFSTFVSVLEPYDETPAIVSARRLQLESMDARALPDRFVGAEVVRNDKRTDVWLAIDGRGPVEMVAPEHDIHLKGEWAAVTFFEGAGERAALCRTHWIRIGDVEIVLKPGTEFVELTIGDEAATLVAGDLEHIDYVKRGEQTLRLDASGTR